MTKLKCSICGRNAKHGILPWLTEYPLCRDHALEFRGYALAKFKSKPIKDIKEVIEIGKEFINEAHNRDSTQFLTIP